VLIAIDFVFRMQMLYVRIVRDRQECFKSRRKYTCWGAPIDVYTYVYCEAVKLGTLCILINVVVTQGCAANGIWSTKLTLRSPKCVKFSHMGVALTLYAFSVMKQAL
jgi:hypothetical protein